ncbi:MAG: HPr family phosphocarrier protein [Candidatus Peribacteraceae bacterium]|nr:HPr family phosphocarrier protein [Candidatus Peribacteraceae bacterium]
MFDSILKLARISEILAETANPEDKVTKVSAALGNTGMHESVRNELRRILHDSDLPPQSILRLEAHLVGIAFDPEDIDSLLQTIMEATNGGEQGYAKKVLEGAFAHYHERGRQYIYNQLQQRGAPESILTEARLMLSDTRGGIALGEADVTAHETHQQVDLEQPSPSVTVRIGLQDSLHIRPSGSFANIAGSYSGSVELRKGTQTADGKSVLEILSLGATLGTEVTLYVEPGKEGEEDIRARLIAILAGSSVNE